MGDHADGLKSTPTSAVEITSDDEKTEDESEMEALWNVFSGRCASVLKSHHVPYSSLKESGKLAGSTTIESVNNSEKHVSTPVALGPKYASPKPGGITLSTTGKGNPGATSDARTNESAGLLPMQPLRPTNFAKKKPKVEWSDPSWILICGIVPVFESWESRNPSSQCYFHDPVTRGHNLPRMSMAKLIWNRMILGICVSAPSPLTQKRGKGGSSVNRDLS